jgi:hypothetical protein
MIRTFARKLGVRVFAAQSFQYDADFLLG